MPFALDPRLAQGSEPLCDLGLCIARVQRDSRFPWIVLIPRRDSARELEDLRSADLAALGAEILKAGAAVRAIGLAMNRPVEKLNVGALGNIVSQLHIHVVGRRADDAAWPGPVWGAGEPTPYDAAALDRVLTAARHALIDGAS